MPARSSDVLPIACLDECPTRAGSGAQAADRRGVASPGQDADTHRTRRPAHRAPREEARAPGPRLLGPPAGSQVAAKEPPQNSRYWGSKMRNPHSATETPDVIRGDAVHLTKRSRPGTSLAPSRSRNTRLPRPLPSVASKYFSRCCSSQSAALVGVTGNLCLPAICSQAWIFPQITGCLLDRLRTSPISFARTAARSPCRRLCPAPQGEGRLDQRATKRRALPPRRPGDDY